MKYPVTLFYREGARGTLTTSYAKIVEDRGNKIYHTEDDEVVAIREDEDKTSVLKKDGEVEDTRVDLVREKEYPHELYLWGGPVYTTDAKIHFLGEYGCSGSLPEYKSSTKIRINDCVLHARGGTNTDWSWEVITNGSACLIEENEDISDIVSRNCMLVGFSDEIDKIQLCQDLV